MTSTLFPGLPSVNITISLKKEYIYIDKHIDIYTIMYIKNDNNSDNMPLAQSFKH